VGIASPLEPRRRFRTYCCIRIIVQSTAGGRDCGIHTSPPGAHSTRLAPRRRSLPVLVSGFEAATE
jgi:hypothetical protein